MSRKTSALIADSCVSVALLAGHDATGETAAALHTYGHEVGLAYQVNTPTRPHMHVHNAPTIT